MTSVVYEDARDIKRNSAVEKEGKSLKHFNYFLKDYCKQINVPVVTADKIPYFRLPIKKDINEEEEAVFREAHVFWDKMMGAFFIYMGTAARCGCNPKGRRLAYQSATGYCSSVKVYYINLEEFRKRRRLQRS
ncbi:hypothetical protein SEMRO_698_G189350.1 [Seminavis robusta]|uniref:Uncharacterized protein n=1 Tax=Seminavis robusta TaxID=568900 RepID=A0A9N8E9L8_9STRA|nr:hypothetical protein SEMRO_698_G189350.1 [Seminavis robusta]|eukprot:Sro698_g189350.1 n/a (133) ;mRNA; f:49621-50019